VWEWGAEGLNRAGEGVLRGCGFGGGLEGGL
jgi:hypothetical protein